MKMSLIFRRYCTRFEKRPYNGFKRDGDKPEDEKEPEEEDNDNIKDSTRPTKPIVIPAKAPRYTFDVH